MPQTRLLFFQSTGQWSASKRLLPAPLPTLLSETLKMRSQKTQKRTRDALALVEALTGKSQEMADLVEQEQANLDVAREIYELRIKAKLSQAELARKVGTTQSVISRLEDADYDGHSLAMLRRIASALEKRVEIRFVPSPKLQHA
jgi:ribosome-binding protein aMBF1 (putative translation factor)